jgi:hypothetical protein
VKGVLCNATSPVSFKSGERMFRYQECADIPGIPISAVEGVYHCGGFMESIPFNATYNEAAAVVDAMATDDGSCLLTDQWATRFVAVEYFIYSPSTDTFHSVKYFSEVTVTGFWYNQWLFRSFQVWTTAKFTQTIIDFVFFVAVMYYWFLFFYELVKHVRGTDRKYKDTSKKGADAVEKGAAGDEDDEFDAAKDKETPAKAIEGRNALSFFLEFWNVLELINLITFIVVFIFRWSWWNVSLSSTNMQMPMDPRYPENLDRLQVLYEGQVWGNSINTMLVFLKLLKYVRLNPRLNVLTRTIAACQQSMFGVLVLFVTVILGYAIAGWTLFGINVDRFRKLGTAMSSLVRMLVGDIDYEELRMENRFLAGLYFWSYMVLALFLLLNFLIAIISESFAAVSGKAYSTPFEELLVRWWQHVKAVYHWKHIKRRCQNICGKSEEELLIEVVADLETDTNRRYAEIVKLRQMDRARRMAELKRSGQEELIFDDDAEDVVIELVFDDLEGIVNPETYNTLSQHYFEFTWEDLMNQFDDARKTDEEVGKRRMADTVQQGVVKVLGDDLDKIDELDTALKSVEEEVSKLLSLLE